ncbi:MAG: MarR family winged helix-turn-helix transcriptional regulator [Sphaerochaeta sp.]|jgi:DNA-binding MarR family transcriptional regulator|uniref:MarR family winged helix-turn-helix transcriptional regulator n=1 Tax=Sphaerochaeta sp. TaxID=1972642 RepID=UPI002FCC3AC9
MDTDAMKAELFGTLFILANRLQVLGDLLDSSVSTKQWLLLAVLLKCPKQQSTLSNLASQMGTSRQNVKKMAQILEQRGFLKLQRPASDKRSVVLSPTQACLDHLTARFPLEQQFIEQFFQGFAYEQLEELHRGFGRWMHNLMEMETGNAREE